ncbi:Glutamine-Rich Protein 2 [Manis pentadactyla]|nr:Glutamine-Rich Protein 2 [Manis pentadactyla]
MGTQQQDWEQQGLQQLDLEQLDWEQMGTQQPDWEQQGLQQPDWEQLDWEQMGTQQLDWEQQGLQQPDWEQPQDPQTPLQPPQAPLQPPQAPQPPLPQLEQEQAGTQQHGGLQQQTGTQQPEPQPPQQEPPPLEQPQQPMVLPCCVGRGSQRGYALLSCALRLQGPAAPVQPSCGWPRRLSLTRWPPLFSHPLLLSPLSFSDWTSVCKKFQIPPAGRSRAPSQGRIFHLQVTDLPFPTVMMDGIFILPGDQWPPLQPKPQREEVQWHVAGARPSLRCVKPLKCGGGMIGLSGLTQKSNIAKA